jgi:hypothetical protein
MELVILGKSVEGQKDLGNPCIIYYQINLGPYEARVTYISYQTYSCHLKFGSEYILIINYNVKTPEKAIELIETALRKYLEDKNFVEQKYSKQ